MGVIKQGILGGFRGSVANVVGTSWKGIAVIKSKPLSVANPRTAGQVTNRDQFSDVVAFATAILTSIIKPLLDRVAVAMSGYNLFVQMNKEFFIGGGLQPASSITISKGTVAPVVDLTCVADDSLGTIVIGWTDNTGVGDALASDVIYAAVYNPNTKDFAVSSGAVARSVGSVSIALPAAWQVAEVLSVYTAFRRLDGTRASNTSYTEPTIIA